MKQIIGWLLLGLGLLIIVWGIWSSFEIFTDRKPAPEIFKVQQTTDQKTTTGDSSQEQISQQIQQTLTEQLGKMLPADSFPRIMNLASWSIFITLLVFAGGKISALGIKLIK